MGPLLAKRQIAPQDGKAGFGESAGQRHKQFRLAIGSRAMRQHQPVAVRPVRNMEKAAHRRLRRRVTDSPDGNRGGHALSF